MNMIITIPAAARFSDVHIATQKTLWNVKYPHVAIALTIKTYLACGMIPINGQLPVVTLILETYIHW